MSDRRLIALGTKRLMDVTIAVTGLVVLAPPLLIVAAAITIESPGPILFAYPRVGKDGKEFRLLKFRAIHWPAEGQQARLTKVGRFIRWTSIDELPQLMNILRGDMSVVGPRALPANPPTDEKAAKMLNLRQRMRPGLTGLGQLLPPADRRGAFLSDTRYVLQHSIALDIGILLKTTIVAFGYPERNLSVAMLLVVAAVLLPSAIMIGFIAAFTGW